MEPTITRYQQSAAEFMNALSALTDTLPKLEISHSTTEHFVRTHQNIPKKFVEAAIHAVARTPEIQGLNKLDVDAARDALQFIEAYKPIADNLVALAESLQFTIDSEWAHLGTRALQIYAIAKACARDASGAAVGQHVENMKRDLGKRGGRPRAVVSAE